MAITVPVELACKNGMIKHYIFTFFITIFFYTTNCYADTYVSGTIPVNTTWTKSNSPYIVTGSIVVPDVIALTIESGVSVRFDGLFSIYVDGVLQAIGTDTEKITFTTNNPNQYWGCIYFRDSSIGATFDEDGNFINGSILEHCVVEYAEGTGDSWYEGAIRTEEASPYINHCTIRFNKCSGISYKGDSESKVSNCYIHNNSADGSNGYGCGGGAMLYNDLFSKLQFYGNVIIKNQCKNDGGGVLASDCSIDISDNIILNNTAQEGRGGGVYILANSTCKTTTIKNNIIAKNEAIDGGGIYAVWMDTISHNHIVDNIADSSSGLFYDDCKFSKFNLLLGNTSNSGDPSNVIGADSRNTSVNISNYNNIFESGTYSVINYNSIDVNFENNWWGTTDVSLIDALIFDIIDDSTIGLIDYFPYLTEVNTDAPISPPQNFHANLSGNDLLLQWSQNPESDVAGYIIYWSHKINYPYEYSIDVGNVTNYTFKKLSLDTYYFTVTAYDQEYSNIIDIPQTLVNEYQTNGNESWYSINITVVIEESAGLPFIPLLLLDE